MKVYVLRHGLTPLNKQKKVNGEIDEPLSIEGIEQTHSVLPLIPKSVIQIYSSSLLRAKQTAKIISSELNIPIQIEKKLSEIRMGMLAGKSWEEMKDGLELKQKHRTMTFDYRPYGGESLEAVKERILQFFKKINSMHKNNEVLIITHGGIIRLMYLLEKGEAIYETEKHLSLLVFDLDKILKNSENSILPIHV